MSFTNIQKIFDTKLSQLSSNPPIAWPNTQFKPANYDLYIRPTLLLSKTNLFTLNDHEEIPGIYQIDIFGQSNKGVQQTYSLADEIKSFYNLNKELSESNTFVKLQAISLSQSIIQDAWFHVIVEVSFLAYNLG